MDKIKYPRAGEQVSRDELDHISTVLAASGDARAMDAFRVFDAEVNGGRKRPPGLKERLDHFIGQLEWLEDFTMGWDRERWEQKRLRFKERKLLVAAAMAGHEEVARVAKELPEIPGVTCDRDCEPVS